MNKSFIVIWLMGFLVIFCAGILFAHIVYSLAMSDFKKNDLPKLEQRNLVLEQAK